MAAEGLNGAQEFIGSMADAAVVTAAAVNAVTSTERLAGQSGWGRSANTIVISMGGRSDVPSIDPRATCRPDGAILRS